MTPDPVLRSREFARILLIKPSSLGDIVHALPVLRALRRSYTHAHIAWLVGESFEALIRSHPDLDETIPFARKRFGKLGRSSGATRDFLRFVRELRNRRFDLVIDLQGLFRSGFLARATGAPVRIGFADAREAAWLFYTHRLPKPTADMHAVDRNLQALQLLGLDAGPITFDLAVTEQERAEAKRLLADSGVADGEPFVAILPGARWETKRWPAERFIEVTEHLASHSNARVVLLGGPDERELCERIASNCNPPPANLAGRTSMRQLIALIEQASVVLCHDSGPMHLAAALNRPMVSILGPTNAARTGPYGRFDTVVRLDLDCSPCYLRRLSRCPHDHKCMRELPAGVLITRLARLLELSAGNADTESGSAIGAESPPAC